MKTVYTASKVKHAHKWRSLRESGVKVNSTWIDEAEVDQTEDFADLWVRCVREAAEADAVILYAEEGDVLKGALVEVGAALAAGKPVYLVGVKKTATPHGSWVLHPLAVECVSMYDAVHQLGYGEV